MMPAIPRTPVYTVYRMPYRILRANLLYASGYYDGVYAGLSKIDSHYIYWRLGGSKHKACCIFIPPSAALLWWLSVMKENMYWWWYDKGPKVHYDGRRTPMSLDQLSRIPCPYRQEVLYLHNFTKGYLPG